MAEMVGVLIIFAVLLGVFALCYKNRFRINKWLNDPSTQNAYSPDRRTVLRRRMEDAEREIELMDEQDTGK